MKVSCFLCVTFYKKFLNPQLLLVIISSGVGAAIDVVFYYCIAAEATNTSLGSEIGVLAVV